MVSAFPGSTPKSQAICVPPALQSLRIMKFTVLTLMFALIGGSAATAIDARAACAADNCPRALRGRLPSASADCVSYQSTTVRTLVTYALPFSMRALNKRRADRIQYHALHGGHQDRCCHHQHGDGVLDGRRQRRYKYVEPSCVPRHTVQ